jgi:hypothetical protein
MRIKTKISDEGSIVLILIIVLVIAVVVGSLFYVVGSQTDKKVVTSFEECAALGNPIREIYPEQCVADGKTFTNPKQKLNDIDIQKPTKVFKIPELGVQFDISEELNNLYYVTYSDDNLNSVRFSLTDLNGTNCEARYTPLASLSKYTEEQIDQNEMYKKDKSDFKQFNGYYFIVEGSQSGCSLDDAITQKASDGRMNILQAVKSTLTPIQ